jgi:glycosyltransferase involved in cell wall biosynthesis
VSARPRIAFFDYPDVFEDFYPHYGVDQRSFATRWAATGNHAFVRLLQQELADVTWYTQSLEPELDEAVHEVTGARVRVVRSSAAHRALWRAFYLSDNSWRWRRAYPAFAAAASYLAPLSAGLLNELRADRPDLIFSQDYASGRFDVLLGIARGLRVPLAAYHSGSVAERYVGQLAKRATIRRADRLIVSSEAERRMLIDRFGVAPDRVAVVLTPIDLGTFRPGDLVPRARRVVFVGRLDDTVKRVSLLIRAFAATAAEHPDAELVVAGTGRDEAELRALAKDLAPRRVRFVGWISEPGELAQLLSGARCLALPSVSEGFPTVIGEALACGTPVVASHVGGIPDVVSPGRNGWLVPPDDADALRLALTQALSADPEPLRRHARKVAEERLSPHVVAAQLREVLPL